MSRHEPNGSLSIMYVEDDPITRDLVAHTLPKRFPTWKVYTAENGKAGLELYRQHSPDIVITDVNMPVMNGILMAGEIKALNPEVVIIAVTAYSETNYLLNAIEIGISHYVLKPIDYRKLFDAIEKSSSGISLKKLFVKQNELITELSTILEHRLFENAVVREERSQFSGSLWDDMGRSLATIRAGMRQLQKAGGRLTEEELFLLRTIDAETERMEQLRESLQPGQHG